MCESWLIPINEYRETCYVGSSFGLLYQQAGLPWGYHAVTLGLLSGYSGVTLGLLWGYLAGTCGVPNARVSTGQVFGELKNSLVLVV